MKIKTTMIASVVTFASLFSIATQAAPQPHAPKTQPKAMQKMNQKQQPKAMQKMNQKQQPKQKLSPHSKK